jgi:phage repressor protein C with HTH and peptisase S24 domain
MSTISGRLKKYVSFKGISQSDFGISVGRSAGWVNNAGKTLKFEQIELLKRKYPDLNVDWVITGEGEMLENKYSYRSDEFIASESETSYRKDNGAKQVSINNYLNVPMVPVYAHAGFLAGYGDAAYWDGLPTELWEVDKEYKGNYVVFEVKGDSMNDESVNSILDGDKILCRELSQIHWTAKLHLNKYYFVIVHREEGIIVKKIKDHNPETGDIVAQSLNPLYEDLHLNLRDVVALYNVVDLKRKPLV